MDILIRQYRIYRRLIEHVTVRRYELECLLAALDPLIIGQNSVKGKHAALGYLRVKEGNIKLALCGLFSRDLVKLVSVPILNSRSEARAVAVLAYGDGHSYKLLLTADKRY